MVSLSLTVIVAKLALFLIPSARATFAPTRISWENLKASNANAQGIDDTSQLLLDTLRNVGLVSLTNIPNLSTIKHETLNALAACIQDDPQVAATHVFDDGTVRRTVATHSMPAAAVAEANNNDDVMPGLLFRGTAPVAASCQYLETVSAAFRQSVQDVTGTFADSLQRLVLLASSQGEPLLRTRQEETAYSGLTHAVYHGEHLEHFHAYERRLEQTEQSSTNESPLTVDWHLDQGLFLVFTPGLQEDKPSDGFYVQLPDGSQGMVQFEPQDDLIILLGDAMHQILNRIMQEPLRIPPHALTVPPGQRVWYGRMVLPPADALVPSMDDVTYGELRHQLIESVHNPDESSSSSSLLGCSSPTLQARHLDEVDCDPETQFFCWHRCFNLTADLTEETCQAKNESLACINDQRQLWNNAHDPAFAPGCVDKDTAEVAPNKTHDHTDAPSLNANSSFSTSLVAAVWGTVAAAVVVLFG